MSEIIMSKAFILVYLIVAAVFISTSATIINIPADYATIQAGINASIDGDTVLVSEGHYHERINFNGKGILLTSAFMLDGDTLHIHNTFIDADTSVLGVADTGSVVCFVNAENAASILHGFAIQNGIGTYINEIWRVGGGIYCDQGTNPQISNNIIRNNFTDYGGGVFCCSAIMKMNAISMNSAHYGGGIYCYGDGLVVYNNIIYENTVTDGGGGLACYNANSIITNCSISMNQALLGGGIYCGNSILSLLNAIIWDNNANHENELYINNSAPLVRFCDVQGGWAGQGNIDADPLFVNPENSDFHLQGGSPCIDAGDPNSPLDPDGTRSDIGAFYFDQSTGIADAFLLPDGFFLYRSYPNPFNASAVIRYKLPQQMQVTIDIYDILGRQVTTLQDGLQSAGNHQVTWNAKGFSSGTYFYKIQAGGFIETKKMLLLK
jgi:hypothetical protein